MKLFQIAQNKPMYKLVEEMKRKAIMCTSSGLKH